MKNNIFDITKEFAKRSTEYDNSFCKVRLILGALSKQHFDTICTIYSFVNPDNTLETFEKDLKKL